MKLLNFNFNFFEKSKQNSKKIGYKCYNWTKTRKDTWDWMFFHFDPKWKICDRKSSFFSPIFCIYRLKMQQLLFSLEESILNIFYREKKHMKADISYFPNIKKNMFFKRSQNCSWKKMKPQIKKVKNIKFRFLPIYPSRSCFDNF